MGSSTASAGPPDQRQSLHVPLAQTLSYRDAALPSLECSQANVTLAAERTSPRSPLSEHQPLLQCSGTLNKECSPPSPKAVRSRTYDGQANLKSSPSLTAQQPSNPATRC